VERSNVLDGKIEAARAVEYRQDRSVCTYGDANK